MNFITLVTAIFIVGIVWGGLTFFLTKAIKAERNKKYNEE